MNTKSVVTSVRERCSDLAEKIGFIERVEEVPSFDGRSDAELGETARGHQDPVERERAIWELGHRSQGAALPSIADVLRREPEPSIRWNLLWLALKVAREEAFSLLESALTDASRDVRDWAKLFLRETLGSDLPREYTDGKYTASGHFDQTLPLQIAGFALVRIPGVGVRRVTLSPLWFEQIMGRVMACTNLVTIEADLTIEKNLSGYHADGSDHYEIFPFSGVSWSSEGSAMQHRYESSTLRAFYTSGKVEDRSREVFPDVPVILNRAAESTTERLIVRPEFSDELRRSLTVDPGRIAAQPGRDVLVAAGLGDRGIRLLDGRVVSDVRGQFFGWAHSSLEWYTRAGRVLPGTVQLANPLDPRTASYVNTYLCGTFRGKLSDWDGDGLADVHLIPCHGTPDGRLDYGLDGTNRPDPFA